jgi:hypothetical protein
VYPTEEPVTETLTKDDLRERAEREAPTLYMVLDMAYGIPGSATVADAQDELFTLLDRRVMGAKEVAAVFGVEVSNLRPKKRVPAVRDLPEPFAQLASGPVWWARDIEARAERWRAEKEER